MASRVVVLIIFIIVNTTFTYQAVWGKKGLLEHEAVVAQYKEAQERCARLDRENKALSREIRLLQNDRPYIEKMIRERLRFLHSNEILYIFGDEDESAGGNQADRSKRER